MNSFRSEVYIIGEQSGKFESKTIHDEIFLKHNEHYAIEIHNRSNVKMLSEISIGGKFISCIMTKPNTKTRIERPGDVPNKFKCVKRESLTPEQESLVDKNFDKIEVICKFEKVYRRRLHGVSALRVFTDCTSSSSSSSSEAGTVLSRELSNQNFYSCESFDVEVNEENYVYRLRVKDTQHRQQNSSGLLFE